MTVRTHNGRTTPTQHPSTTSKEALSALLYALPITFPSKKGGEEISGYFDEYETVSSTPVYFTVNSIQYFPLNTYIFCMLKLLKIKFICYWYYSLI